jgi:hypothetical protein
MLGSPSYVTINLIPVLLRSVLAFGDFFGCSEIVFTLSGLLIVLIKRFGLILV